MNSYWCGFIGVTFITHICTYWWGHRNGQRDVERELEGEGDW